MKQNQKITGPTWDNSKEYQGFDDPLIQEDLNSAQALLKEVEDLSEGLEGSIEISKNATPIGSPKEVSSAQKVCVSLLEFQIKLGNLSTFASCTLSVDGGHPEAKALLDQTQQLAAQGYSVGKAYTLWLSRADDDTIQSFLDHPEACHESFKVSRLRKLKDQLLSLKEEKLIEELATSGPTAFGNLYDDISSKIQCQVPSQSCTPLGLAEAASILESSDPNLRQEAYQAINSSWQKQEQSCAAIINSLAGWRRELCKKRGTQFLDAPLHSSRIELNTLDTMMDVIQENGEIAQDALKTQAKILGQETLGPWDLFAPFPKKDSDASSSWTFTEAIKLIKDAFSQIHPSMADFVQKMVDEKWIDGSVSPHKRPGAYCTKFLKSRTPRVYMTYTGGIKDVITLAHELGHAFHNWVMRDLPLQKTGYPMTLAETASIFAQTAVNDFLLNNCKSNEERLSVLWTDSREAEAFLLNIPVRYQFEKSFYELRQNGPLSPDSLKDLMSKSWKALYGDSLSEGNEMFWASKLHFHISGLSFYNFPYSFGYLFSLGVYSRRAILGDSFFDSYISLLRDTGMMTAEDLARKHLGVELGEREFWQSSIDIIGAKMTEFQSLASNMS